MSGALVLCYTVYMTANSDDKTINQAIIAREIIDIYFEATDKPNVAESLDVLCFAMARLTDSDKTANAPIDWDELAGSFDAIAISDADSQQAQVIEKDIKTTYDKVVRMVEKKILG